MTWKKSLRLSDTLADALVLCGKICRDYEMEIVHPGAVALALLADPRSGASRYLLRVSKLSHNRLTEYVQEEVIGRNLEGVDRLMQRHLSGVDQRKADSVPT